MTACTSTPVPHNRVVETISGKVRGTRSGGVDAFLGIPYARAARFRAPEPAEPWPGIRDCTAFGPSAPQTDPSPVTSPSPIILRQLAPPPGAAPPQRPMESEDCQVLNIWTAAPRHGENRPVMVWLHGGFFSSSSGSTVNGTALAEKYGVVVVSLNHRLNLFGFTDLSHLGSEFESSANAGMFDIIAALAWIRENIAGFGGDPRRIMVFGTSGGGMKTSVLMASPAASGLFHRAGVQSGPGLSFLAPSQAAEATEMLLFETGLAHSAAADLQSLPVETLLRAYHRIASRVPPARFTDVPCFGPVVDGRLLERQPFSPDAAASTGAIPMIIGSNSDEMTFFMGNDEAGFALDESGFETRVSDLARTGAEADRIVKHYRARMPSASPSQRWIRFFSDYSIALPVHLQAMRHAAASQGRTWLYQLTLASPALEGKLGSTHTLETPLLFNAHRRSPLLAGSDAAARVAAMMSEAWAHFAADEEPGQAEWEPYSERQGGMVFGHETAFVPNLDQDTIALLESAFPH